MGEQTTLINISYDHMMLRLANPPFYGLSCYLKLKPQRKSMCGITISGLPGYCKLGTSMLTFPVMLTSQCCYDPRRENFRRSNMFLMVQRVQSLLMFGRKKSLLFYP